MSSSSSSTIPSIATNCKDSSPVNYIPYLPDELLLNCLARVSRLYHPTLFLVSKRFRSLVVSMSLFKTRKFIGCTESCLYVCLLDELNPYWFILSKGPTRIPYSNPKPTLVSIPSRDYFPTHGWDVIADGYDIYMTGGFNYSDNNDDDHPSCKVFVMDCRSHTWCEAPSMRVAPHTSSMGGEYPKNPSACVLDGKIYVARNMDLSYYDFSNWIECCDPKTQKWEHLPSPVGRPKYMYKILAIKGELFLLRDFENVLVYKPNENRWDEVDWERNMVRWMQEEPGSFRVIDNIIYSVSRGWMFVWYDFKRGLSRGYVKLVKELPKLPRDCDVRLVNYGGKLAVLWEEDVSEFWCAIGGSNEKMIWCAVISLERRNEQEIYGKVEWCEVVFTVPKSVCIDKCIAVTV